MELNEIYEKASGGDKKAKAKLFQHLEKSFRRFLQRKVMNPQDIEDILQNALITISEKYLSIRIETSFAAWAHKILYYKLGDYFQKKASKKRRFEIPLRKDIDITHNTEPLILVKLLECIRKIHKVNVNHVRILSLSYQGYTTEEICNRLNWTPNKLHMALHNARRLLKRCLDSGDID
jgi:RNA polymerase sigma-70 factor (ECF subfamily)